MRESDLKKLSAIGTWRKCAGAVRRNCAAGVSKSSLFNCCGNSDFFSECLPLAISLQSEQGCFPSKVFTNASFKEASCEYVTTIPTHATDWKNAQCSPIELAKAKANATLASRGSTINFSPLLQ